MSAVNEDQSPKDYSNMTLAAFHAEFPDIIDCEIIGTLAFFFGKRTLEDTVECLLYNCPLSADKLARGMDREKYISLLKDIITLCAYHWSDEGIKYIFQKYSDIIDNDVLLCVIRGTHRPHQLKLIMDIIPQARTNWGLVAFTYRLDIDQIMPYIENIPEYIESFVAEYRQPTNNLRLLIPANTVVRTIMRVGKHTAHNYFKDLDDACFRDGELYQLAVEHCSPEVDETVFGLFMRNTPITRDMLNTPGLTSLRRHITEMA